MKKNTLAICEAGIMIALSTVLAMLKLIDMPYGGSVTFAQMLPILIYAYRHGPRYGMGAALCASLIQLLLGAENFSYLPLTTWYSVVVLGLMDYVIAYSAFGISAFLKKKYDYRKAIIFGGLIASGIRYLCHVISGFTAWAAFEIPTAGVLGYSFGYNATYMIPETIVLVAAAYYITSAIDFSGDRPLRARGGEEKLSPASLLSGLIISAAIIIDTALIFPKLQDSESGDFILRGLLDVNWIAVGIITILAVAGALAIRIFDKKRT